jgi:hypothetical protein
MTETIYLNAMHAPTGRDPADFFAHELQAKASALTLTEVTTTRGSIW